MGQLCWQTLLKNSGRQRANPRGRKTKYKFKKNSTSDHKQKMSWDIAKEND